MNDLSLLTLLLNTGKHPKPPKQSEIHDRIFATACTLKELFASDDAIEIPEYQRPYVWTIEKLRVLLDDLEAFFVNLRYSPTGADQEFYLGTILLHKKSEKVLSIIDGQQRITTVLILDYIVNNRRSALLIAPDRLKLVYKSPISRRTIIQNRNYLKRELVARGIKEACKAVLQKIVVSVILTKAEDDAFTFFDTQNTKGVQLSATDFLKSYHLRELKGREALQRRFAGTWDKNNRNQFLKPLFEEVLWRGRSWKGRKMNYESRDALLLEFQTRAIKADRQDRIAIYPNARNAISFELSFSENLELGPEAAFALRLDRPLQYPFTLRQPIQRGVGFFLYAERYCRLYNYIFVQEIRKNQEVEAVNHFYASVYDGVSDYLRELFELCIVMYYDKFEAEKLLAFALWLDYLIGSYRIKQNSVVAQTPIKILRDNENNLLDIIHAAYMPEEVFTFIEFIANDSWYTDEQIEEGRGVQARYKRQVRKYYDKISEGSLANKKQWLHGKIRKGQE